eukprot:scpid86097/ scgid7924/ 
MHSYTPVWFQPEPQSLLPHHFNPPHSLPLPTPQWARRLILLFFLLHPCPVPLWGLRFCSASRSWFCARPPYTIDRYTSSGRRKILAQPQVSNLELKASPPNPVVPHSESAVLRSSCAWHVEPTECRAYGCTSQQAEEAIYCEIH